MKITLLLCCVPFVLLIHFIHVECKRERNCPRVRNNPFFFGGPRKPKPRQPYPKQPAPAPKPSAPNPKPKETTHFQHTSNSQPPIGWNVEGKNPNNNNWKPGYQTSGGSSSWSSKKTKSDEPYPKQPVPVHPKPTIKKESTNFQQASNAKSPVGWNVDGTNQNNGWKSGYQSSGRKNFTI